MPDDLQILEEPPQSAPQGIAPPSGSSAQHERIRELEAQLQSYEQHGDDYCEERVDLTNELAWETALLDTDRTYRLSRATLRRARELGHLPGLAAALRNLAYYHLLITRLGRGLNLAKHSIRLFREVGDRKGESTALDIASNANFYLGRYEQSLEYALANREACREVGFVRGEAWAHHNMGRIHVALAEYVDALPHFHKARELFQQSGHIAGVARTHWEIGHFYKHQEDFENALKNYDISLKMSREDGQLLGEAGALLEVGGMYHQLGRRDKALEAYGHCLLILRKIRNRAIEAEVLLNLGSLHREVGKLDLAEENLLQALDALDHSDALPTTFRVHRGLAELYEARGDYVKALHHSKQYQKIKDQVFNAENNLRMRNLQVRLRVESAEKEAELNRLRYEEKAAAEAELARTLKTLSDDLDLARKVQASVLNRECPRCNELQTAVYFEPMIQIGGDIYDIIQRKRGVHRIFLADATGHGVQAALTTMIIKNEYDRLSELDAPVDEILRRLNAAYRARYGKLNAYFTAVLADIDAVEGRVSIACGGHPDQVFVHAGKGRSINARGTVLGAFDAARYHTETFAMQAGDTLVLFSDGLDETQNAAGELYGIDRVQAFAERNAALHAEQMVHALAADARDFRGNAPVTDDLTIVALRM